MKFMQIAKYEQFEKINSGKFDEKSQMAFRLAHVLGESNRIEYYRKLVSDYPIELVRKALVDCVKVPKHRILKNRAALFKSILNKYANNTTSKSSD